MAEDAPGPSHQGDGDEKREAAPDAAGASSRASALAMPKCGADPVEQSYAAPQSSAPPCQPRAPLGATLHMGGKSVVTTGGTQHSCKSARTAARDDESLALVCFGPIVPHTACRSLHNET